MTLGHNIIPRQNFATGSLFYTGGGTLIIHNKVTGGRNSTSTSHSIMTRGHSDIGVDFLSHGQYWGQLEIKTSCLAALYSVYGFQLSSDLPVTRREQDLIYRFTGSVVNIALIKRTFSNLHKNINTVMCT